jgi:hypothetical protein
MVPGTRDQDGPLGLPAAIAVSTPSTAAGSCAIRNAL